MITLVHEFLTEFMHLLWVVLPFFFLGVSFGALIETVIKPETLIRVLDKSPGPIVNSAILGIVLPGCACATLPMAEGLKSKGSSLASVGSHLSYLHPCFRLKHWF